MREPAQLFEGARHSLRDDVERAPVRVAKPRAVSFVPARKHAGELVPVRSRVSSVNRERERYVARRAFGEGEAGAWVVHGPALRARVLRRAVVEHGAIAPRADLCRHSITRATLPFNRHVPQAGDDGSLHGCTHRNV